MTATRTTAARRCGRGRDTGAGTVEYVAAIAVAAAVVVAVVLGVRTGDPAEMVRHAVCAIKTAVGAAGTCPSSSRTPYEQAVSGRYVGMGDSYSSGEGAWNYDEGTDFDDRNDLWPFDDDTELHNRCHRSADAYARILSGSNDFAGGSTFVACSGSMIPDLSNPNHKETDEPPQLDALDDDVSLVTLTLGGNDLGFGAVVQDCVLNGEQGVPFAPTCRATHDDRIAKRLPELRAELLASYRQIREKAPNARIVVVGYPELFVENPSDNYGNLLFAEDQLWMNQKAAELNAMLASAAKDAGAEFVDPTEAFRGHGIGSADSWINDLDFGGPGVMLADPSSFHPNAAGHAALAELIQQQLEQPR